MEPINYMLDVKNPIEEAMRGYGLGRADIEQRQIMDMRAAAEARAASEFEMRRAEAERQRAAAEAGQAELIRLAGLGANATADDYTRAFVANPGIRQDLSSLKTMFEAPKLETMLRTSQDLYAAARMGNIDAVRNQLTVQLEAAKNSGDEGMAATYGSALEQLNTNPEMGLNAIAATSAFTMMELKGPEYVAGIDKVLGVGGETADVQSTDYIGGIAVVTTMNDGTVQIKNAKTNEVVTGQAADDLLKEAADLEKQMAGGKAGAAESAKLQAQADLGAVAAAAQEGGRAAIQLATEAYKQLGTVRSNIANLDRAIQLVEVEGANTGVIESKLPSWNASTIELENMQNVLGLDVIGAVTFGALSEGELALALNTALPTNLDGPDLAAWLRRKKTAQQKLSNYLSQQSRFFSRGYAPGQWFDFIDSGEKDMAGWMRKNPPGSGQGTAAPAPTTAAPSGQGLSAEDLQYLEGN